MMEYVRRVQGALSVQGARRRCKVQWACRMQDKGAGSGEPECEVQSKEAWTLDSMVKVQCAEGVQEAKVKVQGKDVCLLGKGAMWGGRARGKSKGAR